LEIMFQLIKDSCGTRKFIKQVTTSFQKKDPCQIGSLQVKRK
jgi:hypothetical protein